VDFSDERKKKPDVLVVAGFSRQTPKSGEARKNSTREAELRLRSATAYARAVIKKA